MCLFCVCVCLCVFLCMCVFYMGVCVHMCVVYVCVMFVCVWPTVVTCCYLFTLCCLKVSLKLKKSLEFAVEEPNGIEYTHADVETTVKVSNRTYVWGVGFVLVILCGDDDEDSDEDNNDNDYLLVEFSVIIH